MHLFIEIYYCTGLTNVRTLHVGKHQLEHLFFHARVLLGLAFNLCHILRIWNIGKFELSVFRLTNLVYVYLPSCIVQDSSGAHSVSMYPTFL